MLDAVGMSRNQPLVVYGISETIKALKDHIFNNVIWPDFTKIPSSENPCVVFKTIEVGQTISVDQVQITALPVNHSIPGNGYWIDSGEGALVFSGDTGPCAAFWSAINEKVNASGLDKDKNKDRDSDYLKHLIIETSFTDAEQGLAKLSGHYHPELLVADLQKLNSACNVWITHLKPDESAKIMEEISHHTAGKRKSESLKSGQLLTF
jgi:cAMP phosphodiesterase